VQSCLIHNDIGQHVAKSYCLEDNAAPV